MKSRLMSAAAINKYINEKTIIPHTVSRLEPVLGPNLLTEDRLGEGGCNTSDTQ